MSTSLQGGDPLLPGGVAVDWPLLLEGSRVVFEELLLPAKDCKPG